LIDLADDSISAVYSYFDPDQPRRSLGVYMMLDLVRRAQKLGLSHVYLGYWIEGSATMDYKRRFPGLEALEDAVWRPIEAE
jgi:arginine-tRNA-protein transferase